MGVSSFRESYGLLMSSPNSSSSVLVICSIILLWYLRGIYPFIACSMTVFGRIY